MIFRLLKLTIKKKTLLYTYISNLRHTKRIWHFQNDLAMEGNLFILSSCFAFLVNSIFLIPQFKESTQSLQFLLEIRKIKIRKNKTYGLYK